MRLEFFFSLAFGNALLVFIIYFFLLGHSRLILWTRMLHLMGLKMKSS